MVAPTDGVLIHSAQEAAEALVRAFGMRFGDILIRVSEGQVAVIRAGHAYKAEALRGLKVKPP
jgi:hypothetical protein